MPNSRQPRKRVVLPMVRQSWRDVTFLHWRCEPEALAPLLPPKLTIDTFDGSAWVTLTPFRTTAEVAAIAPLPGPKDFPETNVRTYVHGPDGRDGLWFFSLDVTNRANTFFGRVLGLPYRTSDMSVTSGELVNYCGRRRGDDAAGYSITVAPGTEPAEEALDAFVTARWSAYVRSKYLLLRHDVDHEPWPLRRAELVHCEQTLLRAAHLPVPAAPPLVHFASRVTATLSRPHLVSVG